mmetsp:Transcript_10602/g.20035  ORF Transcript_10602/g.20035 Transcript_10602/m.20035 type:complete len:191 (+) Transcript_10602:89-661(+)
MTKIKPCFSFIYVSMFFSFLPSPQATTYQQLWQLQPRPSSRAVRVGDVVRFVWSGEHNVARCASENDFNNCNCTNVISSAGAAQYEHTFNTEGTEFFICAVPGHCKVADMKMYINVTAAVLGITPVRTTPKCTHPSISDSNPARNKVEDTASCDENSRFTTKWVMSDGAERFECKSKFPTSGTLGCHRDS